MRKWEELFETKFQIQLKPNSKSNRKQIHDLALNGKDEELTSIFSVFPSFSNKMDNRNKTPLYYAIDGNNLLTCELLLDLGADIFLDDMVKNSWQYQVYGEECILIFILFYSFVLVFSSCLLWKESSKSRYHQTLH